MHIDLKPFDLVLFCIGQLEFVRNYLKLILFYLEFGNTHLKHEILWENPAHILL